MCANQHTRLTPAVVCITRQTNRRRVWEHGPGVCAAMMLILVILAVSAVVVSALPLGFRVHADMASDRLGWMSHQWLAEYRAAHPT